MVQWSSGVSQMWSAHNPELRISSDGAFGSATSRSATATVWRSGPTRYAWYHATPRFGYRPSRSQPPIEPSGAKKSKYHDSLQNGSGPGSWRPSSTASTGRTTGSSGDAPVVLTFLDHAAVVAFHGGEHLVERLRHIARHGPVEVVRDASDLGERPQEREVDVRAATDLVVARHRRDVPVVLRLRDADRGDDAVELVEGHRDELAAVGAEEPEADDVVEVVLGRVVRRAEVGHGELDAVEHERCGEVVVRHVLRDVGPPEVAVAEPVEVAHEQAPRRVPGHLVGAGVAVARTCVEVEEEQVVHERGAEPLDARSILRVLDRDRSVQQRGDRFVGV